MTHSMPAAGGARWDVSRRSGPTLDAVKTVVLGPLPHELESLIARRRALGLDRYDEVWGGTYHMAPAAHPIHGFVDHALAVLLDPYAKAAGLVATGPFNLGTPEDYRVPDQGYHRTLPEEAWVASAVLVVEVVSPDDETYEKFGFYATHGVDEILVANPADRSVRCHRRTGGAYQETAASSLLGVTMDRIVSGIAWPDLGDLAAS